MKSYVDKERRKAFEDDYSMRRQGASFKSLPARYRDTPILRDLSRNDDHPAESGGNKASSLNNEDPHKPI